MPVDPVRDAAIDVLLRVFDRDMHLDHALDKTLRRKDLGDRGRRFLTQLVYGTVRHKLLCDHVLRRLCTQPLEELPSAIHTILRMAVFQALFQTQVTPPAMVHTSVELAKKRGHAGLARLTNAVLRKAPLTIDAVPLPDRAKNLSRFLSVRYSMPAWLIECWLEEWGEAQTEGLCRASNTPIPPSLRVNLCKTGVAELQELLAKSGIATEKRTIVPEELSLVNFAPLAKSKWFQQGYFMQQDPASMLPPHLLEPQAGETVLDVCAAPGGKTTHLAALAGPEARVLAMDLQHYRLQMLCEGGARLGFENVHVVCGDGAHAPFLGPFDRVLVDAPCSGLGTLRRHPDLKWRMQPEAIERLAAQQRELLLSAAALCKNGGLIVYSVCTFTRQETRDLVDGVLRETSLIPEDGPEFMNPWKIALGQYRTLPNEEGLDGFFLTRFRKPS